MRALPGRAWWWLLAGVLAGGALVAWWLPAEALDWRRAQAWSQPWRWWTAAWVHLGALHLGANLAACALVALLGHAAGLGRRAALAWALAWPLTQLALLADPAADPFGGLSGVLHAGVAVAAVALLGQAPRRRRAVGLALATGVLVKLGVEGAWQGGLRVSEALGGLVVAPRAHANGVVAGALLALVLRPWRATDEAAP